MRVLLAVFGASLKAYRHSRQKATTDQEIWRRSHGIVIPALRKLGVSTVWSQRKPSGCGTYNPGYAEKKSTLPFAKFQALVEIYGISTKIDSVLNIGLLYCAIEFTTFDF
ncbi:MAG: hypothetical protein HY731_02740 [Candidatus Tectomicrobia bacterium]|nr:hypothetical protein [Candidatus Tectomicrobia bacterium]